MYLIVLLRLLINLELVELQRLDHVFDPIESFLRNRKLEVVLNGKLSQE